MAPQDPALDPLVALTWAAAHTTTLRLATGIVILPQRNPVVLAKQIASLDQLSGGRFTFGVGVGYLEPEFRAIGADFDNRGAITDEYLAAMQHLWYDEHPEFHGRFADFAGVDAHPRPLQQPVPIVIGGHTPRAYRRAVASGHGWYGFAMKPPDVAGCVAGLRARRGRDRPPVRARAARDHRDATRAAHARGRGRVRRARRRSPRSVPGADPGRSRRGDRGRAGVGRSSVGARISHRQRSPDPRPADGDLARSGTRGRTG